MVLHPSATDGQPLSPSDDWTTYLQGLVPLGRRFLDRLDLAEDPALRQEAYRYIYCTLAQGYFALHYQDTRYPDFWPVFHQAFNFFLPNPDDTYQQAVVDDDGIYKITGVRGTRRAVDFQIASGTFTPYGHGKQGPTLRNFDLDHDVRLGPDGSFEVVLSACRPAGWEGDWWTLDPGATHIWIRQVAYDLQREIDGRFAIERLDVPALRPRDGSARIAEGMRGMTELTANWLDYNRRWHGGLVSRGLSNRLVVVDMSDIGGIKNQRYVEGLFDIADDEALILETEIPETCRYWAFQLGNELMMTLDWMNHPVTLNGHDSRIDADGRLRAVIAMHDPGVPNWLSTAGYRRGAIFGRWKECNRYPEPTLTKVKLEQVRQHLPTDTPSVTAEQRDAQIRAMRRGVQLRNRW